MLALEIHIPKVLEGGFKKHGVKIVDKGRWLSQLGHGEKSVRFEVRFGDCGYDKGKS